MIYFVSSKSLVDDFKSSLMRNFEMTDLCLLKYFLGIEVIQVKDGIFISQKKYEEDILENFHMIIVKHQLHL